MIGIDNWLSIIKLYMIKVLIDAGCFYWFDNPNFKNLLPERNMKIKDEICQASNCSTRQAFKGYFVSLKA